MSTLTKSRHKGKADGRRKQTESNHFPTHVFGRRYVVLTAKIYMIDWPEHLNSIPPGWARAIEGDFRVDDCDFATREMSLRWAALENEAVIRNCDKAMSDTNDDHKFDWSIAFEVGTVEEGSFISVEGGAVAAMNIRTTIRPVELTAEESEAANA